MVAIATSLLLLVTLSCNVDDEVMDLAKTYFCWYYINANTIVVVETIIGDF